MTGDKVDRTALAKELGLHAIALDASRLASQSPDGAVEFTAAARTELIGVLKALGQSPDLKFAIETLLVVATNLKVELEQDAAAQQLVEIAETAAMDLQEQNAAKASDVQDVADQAKEHISRLAGEAPTTKKAPKYGAATPEGAVKLSSLFNPVFQKPRRR